jgi:hypothetical protein
MGRPYHAITPRDVSLSPFIMKNQSYIYTCTREKLKRNTGENLQKMSYDDHVNERESIHTYTKTSEQDQEKENDR